jgi:hypothetical protein
MRSSIKVSIGRKFSYRYPAKLSSIMGVSMKRMQLASQQLMPWVNLTGPFLRAVFPDVIIRELQFAAITGR